MMDQCGPLCVQASVTPNGTRVPVAASVPQLLTTSADGPGQCNADISAGTPLAAFQSIVTFLTGNNFYVVWTRGPSCMHMRRHAQLKPKKSAAMHSSCHLLPVVATKALRCSAWVGHVR